jgi:hypothetical protein
VNPQFVDGLVYSLAGFIVGYVTCAGVRFAMESQHSLAVRWRHFGDRIRTIFGILLLLLATLSLVGIYESNSCFREGLEQRSYAQGVNTLAQIEEIRAQRELLNVQNPNRDPAISRAAIGRYLAALDAQERSLLELEAARAANPLECR